MTAFSCVDAPVIEYQSKGEDHTRLFFNQTNTESGNVARTGMPLSRKATRGLLGLSRVRQPAFNRGSQRF